MKHFLDTIGMALVCVGVVVIVLAYALGCNDTNAINIAGTCAIALGIVLYVRSLKRESDY